VPAARLTELDRALRELEGALARTTNPNRSAG
jgi:hypothetical protein